MRFLRYREGGRLGLAVARKNEGFTGYRAGDAGYPGDLTPALIQRLGLEGIGEALSTGAPVDESRIERLPPVTGMRKIICVGLNYVDHAAEAGRQVPVAPTIFARFESSLVGDGEPLVRPRASEQFDYEGELVAVIGQGGRHIAKADALRHVAGYSLFNDGSIRDVQLRTPQWTIGKNFDGTGAFGPYLVSADEVPAGARGLRLVTRLNGQVVQDAATDDMVFDVATLVSTLSETLTLEAGDVIVTGTPSGVGMARKPALWMKKGDVCEVEVQGIGILRNTVQNEE